MAWLQAGVDAVSLVSQTAVTEFVAQYRGRIVTRILLQSIVVPAKDDNMANSMKPPATPSVRNMSIHVIKSSNGTLHNRASRQIKAFKATPSRHFMLMTPHPRPRLASRTIERSTIPKTLSRPTHLKQRRAN